MSYQIRRKGHMVCGAALQNHRLSYKIERQCAISAVEARHSPEVEARGSNPRWHETLKPLESLDFNGFVSLWGE